MSFPLTAAERFVDFPAHDNHIALQRLRIERAAKPRTRALAYIIADLRLPTYPAQLALAASIEVRLGATATFGFREARRELAAQRAQSSVKAVYEIPDAGKYGEIARGGLHRVRDLVRHRSRQSAAAVTYAATAAAASVDDPADKLAAVAAATQTALRTLHNHVLELVGETLNMGRTAGALTLASPPEFALRSEQLDKATCDLCTREHGEIYQLDSPEYWAHLPPSNCLGGGRCRGMMVFSYRLDDARLPDPSEDDLAQLRAA